MYTLVGVFNLERFNFNTYDFLADAVYDYGRFSYWCPDVIWFLYDSTGKEVTFNV